MPLLDINQLYDHFGLRTCAVTIPKEMAKTMPMPMPIAVALGCKADLDALRKPILKLLEVCMAAYRGHNVKFSVGAGLADCLTPPALPACLAIQLLG